MTRPRKKSRRKRDSNPGSSALEADALTTRPTRWSMIGNLLDVFGSCERHSKLTEVYIPFRPISKETLFVVCIGGRNSSLVVFGLAVHSVAGSILLWGNFPVEGIFPLELTWVQTPFPQKTLSDESINRGLVFAHMHFIAGLKRS